ncbi:MAG: hypothetical protein ACHQKY_10340 [Terriglobia bacterium]
MATAELAEICETELGLESGKLIVDGLMVRVKAIAAYDREPHTPRPTTARITINRFLACLFSIA